jgi:hypothetical protein
MSGLLSDRQQQELYVCEANLIYPSFDQPHFKPVIDPYLITCNSAGLTKTYEQFRQEAPGLVGGSPFRVLLSTIHIGLGLD